LIKELDEIDGRIDGTFRNQIEGKVDRLLDECVRIFEFVTVVVFPVLEQDDQMEPEKLRIALVQPRPLGDLPAAFSFLYNGGREFLKSFSKIPQANGGVLRI
jgi:hypothetical protein